MEQDLCAICLETTVSLVSSCCGQCICETCIKKLKKKTCPFCRSKYFSTIKGTSLKDVFDSTTDKSAWDTEEKSQVEKELDQLDQKLTRACKKWPETFGSSDEKDGYLSIVIKDIDSIKKNAKISKTMQVKELREILADLFDLCPEKIRLIVKGTPLLIDKKIEETIVRAGDIIHVVKQMSGS